MKKTFRWIIWLRKEWIMNIEEVEGTMVRGCSSHVCFFMSSFLWGYTHLIIPYICFHMFFQLSLQSPFLTKFNSYFFPIILTIQIYNAYLILSSFLYMHTHFAGPLILVSLSNIFNFIQFPTAFKLLTGFSFYPILIH